MIDLHVHTWRCRHADGTPEQYVRAAAERGVRTLAFTEHLPLDPAIAARVPGAEGYAMPLGEYDAYVAEVAEAAVLGQALGVEVLLGAECDAVVGSFEHAERLLANRPFDIVLGSVHFVDDWAFDDPGLIDRYADWRLEDLWARYFEGLMLAARSGVADVLAHADLVKKFCGRPATPVEHHYALAAEVCAEVGMAVEINTAGLRKPCRELYPAQDFLVALHDAGVGITLGSDAHHPSDVAAGMDRATEALRAAGYTSVLVFRGRQPEEVGLDEL